MVAKKAFFQNITVFSAFYIEVVFSHFIKFIFLFKKKHIFYWKTLCSYVSKKPYYFIWILRQICNNLVMKNFPNSEWSESCAIVELAGKQKRKRTPLCRTDCLRGLADVLLRPEPAALPLPVVFNSFRLAKRAHNSSTRRRIGSVACLIWSLFELCVTSLVANSSPWESVSRSCLCRNFNFWGPVVRLSAVLCSTNHLLRKSSVSVNMLNYLW